MSFVGNFSISQGTDPTQFTLTDTSIGSDPSLTGRRVYLYLADGTTLVPVGSPTSYIDWPISDTTITITLLTRDYALNIEVDWLSSSPLPPPSTYTLTTMKGFTSNTESFYGGLTQMQASNPLLVNDNHYFENKSKLRTFIDDTINAVDTMNNIFLAQQSLNDAYDMIQNADTLF